MLKSVKVSDYMAANLVTFSPDMEILEAVRQLIEKRISGAPVVDKRGNLVGLLSERDCLEVALEAGYHKSFGGPVSQYMTENVVTVDADTSILALAERFIKERFRRFPVTQDNRLVGQISRRDILRAMNVLQ
ncbi:MAG: CBS domain-containing protein [Gammaproteobacteria bacterium]|nr:MAG: CBS domain-containing protein [Gammaproteobacteria bacterium]PIE38697.1 MAG: CBS domain-containing protein [Gammaproteobacteria bacterium]